VDQPVPIKYGELRMAAIDLNSDLGESYGPWTMGDDAAMLGIVTSANIACGGHASDPETMFKTLSLAREKGVVIGAHPGYPDKEGFGRRRLPYTESEIERFMAAQIGALLGVAALAGARVAYVKPHGAIANVACDETGVAEAIVRAIAAIDRTLVVLAISGTELEHVAKRHGLETYSEIFADRAYTAKGRLVSRSRPDAMVEDADEAATRLVRFFETGLMPTVDGTAIPLAAHSICVHGDSDHAVAMARAVRAALTAAGMELRPFVNA
jgi:UPF0271 protein